MKKYMYGALIGCIFVIVVFIFGANANGAPVLTYVYSGSMEPLIKVNDAFFVWPGSDYHVGDIIMYRPVVLKAPYITHRIVAVGTSGYITKGDNAPAQDQESGEPEVTKDRIVGRAVTFHGRPIIIPELGKFSALVQSGIGRNSVYLSILFLSLGIALALTGRQSARRRRKPRNRLRLRDIYKYTSIIAVLITSVSICLGSRVTQVNYLVSEYPGSLGNQVEVNRADTLTLEIRNNGLIPVWTVMEGIPPLSTKKVPEFLWPRSKAVAALGVSPQSKTGIYYGYVQVYHYPVLMPRFLVIYLHRINPFIAALSEGLILGLYFMIFFRVLSRIHGFEGFIPLRAIRDKIFSRRMKRTRGKLFGIK